MKILILAAFTFAIGMAWNHGYSTGWHEGMNDGRCIHQFYFELPPFKSCTPEMLRKLNEMEATQ